LQERNDAAIGYRRDKAPDEKSDSESKAKIEDTLKRLNDSQFGTSDSLTQADGLTIAGILHKILDRVLPMELEDDDSNLTNDPKERAQRIALAQLNDQHMRNEVDKLIANAMKTDEFSLQLTPEQEQEEAERAARRQVKQALERVSTELGNTAAVCRKSYVHPSVIEQYTRGELSASIARARRAARRRPVRGLREPEAVVLHWLRALPVGPLGERARRRASPRVARSPR